MEQIRKYVIGKTDESETIFIIYAGGNDAYFGYKENTGTPADVIEDLKGVIATLKGVGKLTRALLPELALTILALCRRQIFHHANTSSTGRRLPLFQRLS